MTPGAPTRPEWIAHPEARRHRLESGSLWIRPTAAGEAAEDDPPPSLDDLCGFAARRNPRRGFLFVSRILGRYAPARPAPLDAALTRLAARLPADLPGPVLFVGVAAAGVAIGQRCWARYLERTGRADTVFVATSRHRFEAPLAYAFDEPHSHAPRHRMYRPLDAIARRRFAEARSVVVVDDEVTTGQTFAGFVAAHHRACPAAHHFVHAVLTDWTTARLEAAAPPGCAVRLIALARGRYHFERDPAFAPRMPDVTGDADPRWHAITPGRPRFGHLAPPALGEGPLPAVEPGARLLVLGTGEFQYPALLLAERYAARGVDARFQCTTRAPVLVGGPIAHVMTFDDPWGEGIPNFLYNVRPGQFDRVFVCYESGACAPPWALVDALGAEVLAFGDGPSPATRSR